MNQELSIYIPKAAEPQIREILKYQPLNIVVKKERKTRHGDYRKLKNNRHQITVNANLNNYQFLITLLHEIAHYHAYCSYGAQIKPHGIEWKQTFQKLMLPFLRPEVFPKSILPLLANYIKNPKASSDTDLPLVMALKAFDPPNKKTYIFQIQEGAKFIASNGKTFKKGKKRRSRYACMATDSGRMYAFNPNAEVKLLEG